MWDIDQKSLGPLRYVAQKENPERRGKGKGRGKRELDKVKRKGKGI